MNLLDHHVIIWRLILSFFRIAISDTKTKYSGNILLLRFSLWNGVREGLHEHMSEGGAEVRAIDTCVFPGLWGINIFTMRAE